MHSELTRGFNHRMIDLLAVFLTYRYMLELLELDLVLRFNLQSSKPCLTLTVGRGRDVLDMTLSTALFENTDTVLPLMMYL